MAKSAEQRKDAEVLAKAVAAYKPNRRALKTRALDKREFGRMLDQALRKN